MTDRPCPSVEPQAADLACEIKKQWQPHRTPLTQTVVDGYCELAWLIDVVRLSAAATMKTTYSVNQYGGLLIVKEKNDACVIAPG